MPEFVPRFMPVFVPRFARVAALAVLAAAIVFPPPAPAQDGGPDPAADRALVSAMQEVLEALGYAPGPVDGLFGQRTSRAIAAFQADAGLPADGRPDEALLERMTEALARETAPAADAGEPEAEPLAEPDAAAADAKPPGEPDAAAGALAGTRWRFEDETGARFALSFERDGRIGMGGDGRFWRWRRSGDEVRIGSPMTTAGARGWCARGASRTTAWPAPRRTRAAAAGRGRRSGWRRPRRRAPPGRRRVRAPTRVRARGRGRTWAPTRARSGGRRVRLSSGPGRQDARKRALRRAGSCPAHCSWGPGRGGGSWLVVLAPLLLLA